MSNHLIVDTSLQTQTSQADFSIIGYDTVLPTSTVTGQAEDPLLPFSNALDFRDNTKYSPAAASGSTVIEFTQSNPVTIDYIGFAVHNGATAGLNGTLEVDTGSGYVLEASFGSLTDNRPFMKYFGSRTSVKQRLTLNYTSKLFIGSIYIGAAMVLPRTPSLGFQPAQFSPLDKVEQFTTDGNNFIIGRRINKGFQTKARFRFISFSFIESNWEDFADHVLDSKPVYFKWSGIKDQVTFGLQNPRSLHKPRYATSNHSDISLEINGYA